MEERGIFRYKGLKGFLTMSIFRSLFRPLLFDKSDYIHASFLASLNSCSKTLLSKSLKEEYQTQIGYWLIYFPKFFFEAIFMDGQSEGILSSFTKSADNTIAKKCTYITQAYVIYNIQQLFKNDPAFQNHFGFPVEDMGELFFGRLNLNKEIEDHLIIFRENYSGKISELLDPRNQIVFYSAEILKIFYSNIDIQQKMLIKFDQDLIKKGELIIGGLTMIQELKINGVR